MGLSNTVPNKTRQMSYDKLLTDEMTMQMGTCASPVVDAYLCNHSIPGYRLKPRFLQPTLVDPAVVTEILLQTPRLSRHSPARLQNLLHRFSFQDGSSIVRMKHILQAFTVFGINRVWLCGSHCEVSCPSLWC